MLGNMISAQVVRYVTERVIENISKQASRPADGALPTGIGDLAIAVQLQSRLDGLTVRLDDLDRRQALLAERVVTTEGRTGWAYTLRLTVGVILGIGVGFAIASVGHLAGWIG